jgi:hypothetical protein
VRRCSRRLDRLETLEWEHDLQPSKLFIVEGILNCPHRQIGRGGEGEKNLE